MAFTVSLLEKASQPLDLNLTYAPLPSGLDIPLVPVLTGKYLGYGIEIQPAYETQGSGDGISGHHPYREPCISVALAPRHDDGWAIPPTFRQRSGDNLFGYWKEKYLREAKVQLLDLIPTEQNRILGLLDPARRPLRITEVAIEPRRIAITAEYADRPKVKFQGYSFCLRTDPVDLRKIIDDLAGIVDALPLKDHE